MIVKSVFELCFVFVLCSSSFALHLGLLRHHHSQYRVCLNPPNTLKKVQTHIDECKNEVKTSIFNEAFNVLHDQHDDHDDHHHEFPPELDLHEHEYGASSVHNFTERDKNVLKILDYFDEDDHNKHHHHSHHGIPDVFRPKPPSIPPLPSISSHLSSHSVVRHPSSSISWDVHDFKRHDTGSVPDDLTQQQSLNKLIDDILEQKLNGDRKKTNRRKRDAKIGEDSSPFEIDPFHPATASFKERRLAGCLLHCVYSRNGAIDIVGWPTLDGLVNFFTDDVHEHGFFMSTLRATDYCLKGASIKYSITRNVKPSNGLSCDLALDLFDCVMDKIIEYCHSIRLDNVLGHHPPNPFEKADVV